MDISKPKLVISSASESFVYDGEEYKTVTLSDGSVWMAEPMRYVPEGYTPSGDPAADSHIWYPYSLSGGGDSINATEATALTDDESIRKYGLFYDMYVALVSMTPMQFSGLMRLHRRTSTASREHRASALLDGISLRARNSLISADSPTRTPWERAETRSTQKPSSMMPTTAEANVPSMRKQDGTMCFRA